MAKVRQKRKATASNAKAKGDEGDAPSKKSTKEVDAKPKKAAPRNNRITLIEIMNQEHTAVEVSSKKRKKEGTANEGSAAKRKKGAAKKNKPCSGAPTDIILAKMKKIHMQPKSPSASFADVMKGRKTSDTWENAWKALFDDGLIFAESSGATLFTSDFRLTEKGLEHLMTPEEKEFHASLSTPATTNEQLHERIKKVVCQGHGGRGIEIFDLLLKHGSCQRKQLAAVIGIHDGGHNFSYSLRNLVQEGYVEKDPNNKCNIRLSDTAFLSINDRPEPVEMDPDVLAAAMEKVYGKGIQRKKAKAEAQAAAEAAKAAAKKEIKAASKSVEGGAAKLVKTAEKEAGKVANIPAKAAAKKAEKESTKAANIAAKAAAKKAEKEAIKAASIAAKAAANEAKKADKKATKAANIAAKAAAKRAEKEAAKAAKEAAKEAKKAEKEAAKAAIIAAKAAAKEAKKIEKEAAKVAAKEAKQAKKGTSSRKGKKGRSKAIHEASTASSEVGRGEDPPVDDPWQETNASSKVNYAEVAVPIHEEIIMEDSDGWIVSL